MICFKVVQGHAPLMYLDVLTAVIGSEAQDTAARCRWGRVESASGLMGFANAVRRFFWGIWMGEPPPSLAFINGRLLISRLDILEFPLVLIGFCLGMLILISTRRSTSDSFPHVSCACESKRGYDSIVY